MQTALMDAAAPAAEQPQKTGTAKLTMSTGQLEQAARKPIGVHRDECDKTYRRTGLRNIYHPNIA